MRLSATVAVAFVSGVAGAGLAVLLHRCPESVVQAASEVSPSFVGAERTERCATPQQEAATAQSSESALVPVREARSELRAQRFEGDAAVAELRAEAYLEPLQGEQLAELPEELWDEQAMAQLRSSRLERLRSHAELSEDESASLQALVQGLVEELDAQEQRMENDEQMRPRDALAVERDLVTALYDAQTQLDELLGDARRHRLPEELTDILSYVLPFEETSEEDGV